MVFRGRGAYGYTRVRQGVQGRGEGGSMVPINYVKKLIHF